MKKNIYLIVMLQIMFFHLFSQQGEWTWMNGDNTANSAGVFGTQGVPNPNNTPPPFYEACEWTDLSGNFWLFGGLSFDFYTYSDLWKYNPATNEWTWVKGPGIPAQLGVYGTQGIPSVNNNPGARGWGVATWTDADGNLWLFGGSGIYGYLNDLWKYNISTNEWTWMKGSNISYQSGVYGTIGVSSPVNCPGGRDETSCSWIVDNELWLFGGRGIDVNGTASMLNDLWKYNISTNEWTWMKGSNIYGQPDIYGTKGIADPANTPGARFVYSRWKDNNNNLWLFGGYNYNNASCNDLWKYDIITNNWTWMGGSNQNDVGNYGTKCTPSVNNIPPARFESRACWTDDCGNFWLFGGGQNADAKNDLWYYNVATNEWTWVSGSNIDGQLGNYGTKTVSSPSNMPGSRMGSVSWKDVNGNFWFFGGEYQWPDYYNDLWRYVIYPNCPGFKVIVNNDINICQGATATLTANGVANYQWNTGSTDASITVSPQNTTTYTVTGINVSCSGTDEIVVTVKECLLSELYTPNTFTPNGNGKNDVFKPVFINITEFEMYVFSRWGQEIFHTTDINEGWDGKYKGKLCPQGVYTWLVFYKGVDNTEKQKKYGHVTLLK